MTEAFGDDRLGRHPSLRRHIPRPSGERLVHELDRAGYDASDDGVGKKMTGRSTFLRASHRPHCLQSLAHHPNQPVIA
jgi:hypothetical protein